MAQFWLPGDSDFALAMREPNLLVPGAKPVGDVKIDWSSPLIRPQTDGGSSAYGRGLISAIQFGPHGIRDYAGNDLLGSGYTLISDEGGTAASLSGDYLDCSNSGSCVNLASDYTLAFGGDSSEQAITISALVQFPLPQSLSGIVGDATTVHWSGTTLNYFGASLTYDPANISSGWHRLTAVAWKNSTPEGNAFYIDGEQIHSGSGNMFPGALSIAGIGNMNIGLNRDRGVRIKDFYLWEGYAMSQTAVRAFVDRGVLKPANDSPFLISVPAGGGVPTLSLPGVTGIQATQATPQVTLTF